MTPNDSQFTRIMRDYERDNFRKDITRVRDGINRLLNDIARHEEDLVRVEAAPIAGDPFATMTAVSIARRIAHDVLWSTPNMHLEDLVVNARKYDDAVTAHRDAITRENTVDTQEEVAS